MRISMRLDAGVVVRLSAAIQALHSPACTPMRTRCQPPTALQTVLVFSQDGRFPEITQLIQSIDFAPVVHMLHDPPYLGIPSKFIRTDAPTASNVHFLLRFAFEFIQAPAAVVLESDLELGADGFDYFRWAYQQVSSDAELKSKVLTVNGYYEKSEPTADPFTFTTDEFGFMVWGWLCPAWSWPTIRDGWTWFHNWDITVENSIRKPSGKVSLSPILSRTRNIGMSGINFDIRDPAEVAKWETLHIPTAARDFTGQKLRIIPSDKIAIKRTTVADA